MKFTLQSVAFFAVVFLIFGRPSRNTKNIDRAQCKLLFKDGNVFVDDQIWLTLGRPCVRHDGQEFCHDRIPFKDEMGRRFSRDGTDNIGDVFLERFKFLTVGNSRNNIQQQQEWEVSYRSYENDPATLLFGQHFLKNLKNTSYPASTAQQSASNGMVSWFPSFKINNSTGLGYFELNGGFVGSSNYRIAPLEELNSSSALMSGPLVMFSDTCAIVMSTAASFMSSSSFYRRDMGEFGFGVMGSVTNVPNGHRTSTILSSSSIVGRPDGIRHAFSSWGAKLLRFYGTQRPSDVTLEYLQWSTDNGAFYYYTTEPNKTYQETVLDVKEQANQVGLPFRNWLMDSWWYYKGKAGAVKNWTARPEIFPGGIAYITEKTKWDIVAHNRFWSSETDYAIQNGGKYRFAMEGNLSLPLQEEFWNDLFEQAKLWGLTVYEQDWLDVQTQSMHLTLQTVEGARTWLVQMGNAAKRHNIPIQYCMSWPRHILQSLEIDSVTQARASGDYQPGNDQWAGLGISSMFSFALGIIPLKDNFWSSTLPQPTHRYNPDQEPASKLQSIVATYSTGSVAPSDNMKLMDVALIRKSCANDGRLLQPDMPAVRTDATILAQAGIKVKSKQRNEVWSTMTNLSGYAYTYLLAADSPAFEIDEEDLYSSCFETSGFIVWDLDSSPLSSSNFPKISTAGAVSLPYQVPSSDKTRAHVYCIAPIFPNGWSLLGEAETKWTAVSGDRFSRLVVDDDGFSVSLMGGPGELVHLVLRTPETKFVRVTCGLSPSGRARFHSAAMTCSEIKHNEDVA